MRILRIERKQIIIAVDTSKHNMKTLDSVTLEVKKLFGVSENLNIEAFHRIANHENFELSSNETLFNIAISTGL